MNESVFHAAVLLIIFNRVDNTTLVLDAIRKAKPSRLFVAADGPREGQPDDIEKCALTRAVISQVDWPCEVKTLFQKKNLGCGLGPVTAIDWFFENVSEGIILEDDCVPNISFFRFCEELLEKYRTNDKIMHISGDNFQFGKKRGNASYYFSEYTHNWGWATWARAWKYYDFNLLSPEKRSHIWDKQWMMSVRNHQGLAILPNVNLVSNIGFGPGATHTSEISHFANMPTSSVEFPLAHPKKIERNVLADLRTYRESFGGTYRKLLVQKILHAIPASTRSRLKNIF